MRERWEENQDSFIEWCITDPASASQQNTITEFAQKPYGTVMPKSNLSRSRVATLHLLTPFPFLAIIGQSSAHENFGEIQSYDLASTFVLGYKALLGSY